MSQANTDEAWRAIANRLLDEHEEQPDRALTLNEFAKRVGVSRQTLWRDKIIFGRFKEIRNTTGEKRKTPGGLGRREMRIRALERELTRLESENEILLQNVILICKRLREHGLDPHHFVGEIADNVATASCKLLDD